MNSSLSLPVQGHTLICSTNNVLRRLVLVELEGRHYNATGLTALATGYGRYPLADFALVLRELQKESFPGIKKVSTCLRNGYDVTELMESLMK